MFLRATLDIGTTAIVITRDNRASTDELLSKITGIISKVLVAWVFPKYVTYLWGH